MDRIPGLNGSFNLRWIKILLNDSRNFTKILSLVEFNDKTASFLW